MITLKVAIRGRITTEDYATALTELQVLDPEGIVEVTRIGAAQEFNVTAKVIVSGKLPKGDITQVTAIGWMLANKSRPL